MKAKFQKPTPQHRVETALSCNDLSAPQVIWFTRGSGHGGSLDLWRISRNDVRSELAGILYNGRRHSPVRYIHADLSLAEVQSAIDMASVATTLSVNVVAPTTPSLGQSGFMSSNDFHRSFTLADKTKRQLTRGFTGYVASMEQAKWLPLQLASRPFEDFLERVRKGKRNGQTSKRTYQNSEQAQDIDRAHFSEHFLRAAPHFDEPNNWWVKERYVHLSRSVGSPELIAPLLDQLKSGTDRSIADTRRDALSALKRITGYDPTAHGQRSEEEQITAFKRACTR